MANQRLEYKNDSAFKVCIESMPLIGLHDDNFDIATIHDKVIIYLTTIGLRVLLICYMFKT